jgi:hypothetical protein
MSDLALCSGLARPLRPGERAFTNCGTGRAVLADIARHVIHTRREPSCLELNGIL